MCISSFISVLLSAFPHLPCCLLFIFLLFFFFFFVPPLLMVLLLPLSVVVDIVGGRPLLSIALHTTPLSLAICLSPLPLSVLVHLCCLCRSISISVHLVISPSLSAYLPLFSRRSGCNSYRRRCFPIVFPDVSVRFILYVSNRSPALFRPSFQSGSHCLFGPPAVCKCLSSACLATSV